MKLKMLFFNSLLFIILVTGCGLSGKKQYQVEYTDSLIQVIHQSSLTIEKLRISLNSLESRFEVIETVYREKSFETDTLNQYFMQLSDGMVSGFEELESISSEIDFTGPDLEKFRRDMSDKGFKKPYIDEYLGFTSYTVDAINMRVKKLESFYENQLWVLNFLENHMESNHRYVNEP